MTPNKETARQAFEKWQIQPLEWRSNPKHPNGGRYVDDRIEEEWIVWQAGVAHGMEAGTQERAAIMKTLGITFDADLAEEGASADDPERILSHEEQCDCPKHFCIVHGARTVPEAREERPAPLAVCICCAKEIIEQGGIAGARAENQPGVGSLRKVDPIEHPSCAGCGAPMEPIVFKCSSCGKRACGDLAENQGQGAEADWPECKEFYDMMQLYRHAPVAPQGEVLQRYQEIKKWLRASRTPQSAGGGQ